ncbi:hypothetical protein LXL04_010182 [Taraxacum kok-saghyz]
MAMNYKIDQLSPTLLFVFAVKLRRIVILLLSPFQTTASSAVIALTTGESKMRAFGNILTAVLLCFFLFTELSTAHIISLKLRSDNRHIIPFSDFEFSNVGYVSFFISSVTVTSNSSRPDPSRIGFFLQPRELTNQQQPFDFQQNATICALDLKNNTVLFTFQNLSHDPQFSVNQSWPVTFSGMKSLFFVNCNNESLVTIEGRAELYNINDTKNYLTLSLTQLPFLCFIFFFIYLSFTGVWILVWFKNRCSFNRTHLLMGVLLVMSIVHFMCVAADLHYVKVTGSSDGLDVVFRISSVMRGVLFFTVIMLVGTGWGFWKPVLEGDEKLVLIIVILLQLSGNVDPILPWEAALPYNADGMSFADLICCFVIFISIGKTHIWLGEIRETNLNAHRNFAKLWVLMSMIFIYVAFGKAALAERLITRWANYVGQETGLLVFCIMLFYIFRPVDRRRLNEFYSRV